MRLALQVLVALCALACLFALAVLLVGTRGWFGVQPDGLAAVYAILLAMPWSLLLFAMPGGAEGWSMLVMLGGMAINIAVGGWLTRKRTVRQLPCSR